MPFPSRSPYLRLGLILAVLLPALAGGYYVSTLFIGPRCYVGEEFPDAHATVVVEDISDDLLIEEAPQTFSVEADSREIFKIVEKMPLFPGIDCGEIKKYHKRKACADRAMLSYIYHHVKYPKKARDANHEGMAVVRFVVEPNGVITNIEVVRDPGMGLGEAAAKAVRYMKTDNLRWEPGLQKGKPVRVQFNLPVKFKLE